MAAFLTNYDVILSTVVAGPPPRLGHFDMNGDVATFTERVTEYLGVTPVHNATGTPAMSVPLHWTGMVCRWVCILPVVTAKRARCLNSPPSSRRRNPGSIVCRHFEAGEAGSGGARPERRRRLARLGDMREAKERHG